MDELSPITRSNFYHHFPKRVTPMPELKPPKEEDKPDFSKMYEKSYENIMKEDKEPKIAQAFPLLKDQQAANENVATQSLQEATVNSIDANINNLIDKYQMLLKLALADIKRWRAYVQTKQENIFVANPKNYSEKNWKELNKKLDKIISDLNSVVIG